MSRAVPHRPPKKHNRVEDGWDLIGYYMARDGVVTERDAVIAAALKWKNTHGVPDDRRVRDTRAHVNRRARLEQQQGLAPGDKRRVFSGWSFGYRDIAGSPSVLLDVDNRVNVGANGMFALLGDLTRLQQQSTERDRMAAMFRECALTANAQGDPDLGFAYLDAEHDMKVFGILRDDTVARLRVLLTP